MFNISNNRKEFYNKTLMDYCRKSTEESIRKMVEREKNAPNIILTGNNYSFINKGKR